MAQVGWWLTTDGEDRLRLGAGGALMGRSPGCDVVLRDPRASRSQALVYLDGAQPRLLVLGKGKTLVNGEPSARDARLNHGDLIALPGLSLQVVAAEEPDAAGGWVLERPRGGFFGISSGPFVIGGHAGADLRLVDWPDHALTLHLTQRRMHLVAGTDLEIDGAPAACGALVPLSAGSRIVHRDQVLRVVAFDDATGGSTVLTVGEASTPLPDRVALEFLPRGCRLRVLASGQEHSVYLPGQRAELMALLLSPPTPYALGQTLEDELLLERLWPKQARTRIDLNTLIYRLRKDLVRAGIDATGFVVRAPGGGGTRLALAEHARVEIA